MKNCFLLRVIFLFNFFLICQPLSVFVDDLELQFSPNDDFLKIAHQVLKSYNVTSPSHCNIHGTLMNKHMCAVEFLVKEMQKTSMNDDMNKKCSKCNSQLKLRMPQQGQIWLLRTITFEVILENDPNCEFQNINSFEGELSVMLYENNYLNKNASFAARTKLLKLILTSHEEGYFHITLPDTATSAQIWIYIVASLPNYYSPYQITKNIRDDVEMNLNSTCRLTTSGSFKFHPFSEYDPIQTLTVESLLSRPSFDQMHTGIKNSNRFIFSTLLYDDGYVPGVLKLASSLRKVNSKYRLICLVPYENKDKLNIIHPVGADNDDDDQLKYRDGDVAGVGRRSSIPKLKYHDDNKFGDTITMSAESLWLLNQAGVQIKAVNWLENIGAGTALPSLGSGVWLKLHLWLLDYDKIVYLDADTMVLQNIDELFTLSPIGTEEFAAVNNYFAGAFFVLSPNSIVFISMMEALQSSLSSSSSSTTAGIVTKTQGKEEEIKEVMMKSGMYVYGEQDFLNDYWRGDHHRVVLDYRYHCLAEDVGIFNRDPIFTTSLSQSRTMIIGECKVIEFSSCDITGETGVRWKPWMSATLLEGKPVCRNFPSEAFWDLHQIWLDLPL